jgi:hypothetical protein
MFPVIISRSYRARHHRKGERFSSLRARRNGFGRWHFRGGVPLARAGFPSPSGRQSDGPLSALP